MAGYKQIFLYNKSYQEDNATEDGNILEMHKRHLLRNKIRIYTYCFKMLQFLSSVQIYNSMA